uniref:Uncharacterized protein n=1 Tax=Arundo donax TaxID=35708 RepID=A0A0A9DI80_ARUDO
MYSHEQFPILPFFSKLRKHFAIVRPILPLLMVQQLWTMGAKCLACLMAPSSGQLRAQGLCCGC